MHTKTENLKLSDNNCDHTRASSYTPNSKFHLEPHSIVHNLSSLFCSLFISFSHPYLRDALINS